MQTLTIRLGNIVKVVENFYDIFLNVGFRNLKLENLRHIYFITKKITKFFPNYSTMFLLNEAPECKLLYIAFNDETQECRQGCGKFYDVFLNVGCRILKLENLRYIYFGQKKSLKTPQIPHQDSYSMESLNASSFMQPLTIRLGLGECWQGCGKFWNIFLNVRFRILKLENLRHIYLITKKITKYSPNSSPRFLFNGVPECEHFYVDFNDKTWDWGMLARLQQVLEYLP